MSHNDFKGSASLDPIIKKEPVICLSEMFIKSKRLFDNRPKNGIICSKGKNDGL